MFVCENACLEPIYILCKISWLMSCYLVLGLLFYLPASISIQWEDSIYQKTGPILSVSFLYHISLLHFVVLHRLQNRAYVIHILHVFFFYRLNNKLKYVSCKNLERIYFVCLFTFIILKVKFKTSYQRNTRNVSVYIQLPIFG